MTLEEWHKNPVNRGELVRILEDPYFKRALELVLTSNTPRFDPRDGTEQLALRQAFQGGVHHVPRMLDLLTRPPVKAADSVGGTEWQGAHVVTFPVEPETK